MEKTTRPRASQSAEVLLKIGELSTMVGISATAIRSWERLGLLHPHRTESNYRLYSSDDVKLLKHAKFLRRERRLNPPAIVELLRRNRKIPFMRTEANAERTDSRNVGSLLRRVRGERNLSLQHVAEGTNLSAGFLSALERSQTTASVATLRKLAEFFDINILDLFQTTEASPNLVHPKDRKVLSGGKGVHMELLAWGNISMEPHLFRISPGAGSGEPYSHQGEEFLYALRGQFEIVIDGKKHTLKAGDSLYFDSSVPHEWKNPGKTEAAVLWVNTPPTF